MVNFFVELGIIVIAASIVAFLLHLIRQPMILAYILAGVLIGPAVLGYVPSLEDAMLFSEIGIALLLFLVGLEIDFRRLKDTGKTAVVIGVGQIVLTWLLTFYVATLFGFSGLESFYIGVIMAFSSTMLIVKLYADKNALDTLHGRVSLGILLIQDIVAILVLALIPSLQNPSGALVIESIVKGAILFILAYICSKYIIPFLFRFISESQELLLLSSIAWCFAFAILAHFMNYSYAIGAFLAGLSLASTSYNIEIIAKVKNLRDFFAIIFFVTLGMQLALIDTATVSIFSILIWTVVFSFIVIVGNAVVIMILMSLLGHKKVVSFKTALALSQISEFSLIVAALGLSLGQISPTIAAIATGVAAVTITITTYLINYDDVLYNKFGRKLKIFELLGASDGLDQKEIKQKYDVIIVGYNRIGQRVYNKIKNLHKSILIIDYNPELIAKLKKNNTSCLYADIGDTEIMDRIDFKNVKVVISSAPSIADNELLIKHAKSANKDVMVLVTSEQSDDALKLYQKGADYVVMPHFIGGEHVGALLEQFNNNVPKLVELRLNHIKQLHRKINII